MSKKVFLIDENWVNIKSLILNSIPNTNEYIYNDERYFLILNVIHQVDNNHKILLVVKEFTPIKKI